MSKPSSLKIATRSSPLALWQANFIKEKLEAQYPEIVVELVPMTTRGDQLLDRSLSAVGGKGLFLKELEISLLNNQTDIAVHSMKDVPAELPDGLEMAVYCEREDARDALVSNHFQSLDALPKGARVGTASLRRASQLKNAFPFLEFVELRGNVNTRLAKLDRGEYDAIILAAAGLIRLGFDDRIREYIDPQVCLPAVGQGIVGIECRSNDEATKALLKPLHNQNSELYLAAERAMNSALGGGCQVPVAGYAQLMDGKIRMRGRVGEIDGSTILSANVTGVDLSVKSANKLGREVAMDLILQGAEEILKNINRQADHQSDNIQPDTSIATLNLNQDSALNAPLVVLTREQKYLGNMPSVLETLGFQVALVTTLEANPKSQEEAIQIMATIGEYTDIVFVSRNAVEFGMEALQQAGVKIPESTQVLAMGAESAKQLMKHDVVALFPDQGTGAKALLAVQTLTDLSGRRLLIIRGTQGLDWPAQEMSNRGAVVKQLNVYCQTMPENAESQMQEFIQNSSAARAVFIHSGQSAENFMQLVSGHEESFRETELIVGGQRIANIVSDLGWSGRIKVAESPSNKHMMMAFISSQSTED